MPDGAKDTTATVPVLPNKLTQSQIDGTTPNISKPPTTEKVGNIEIERLPSDNVYDRVKIGGVWYSVPKGTPTSSLATAATLGAASPEQFASRERFIATLATERGNVSPGVKAMLQTENLFSLQNRLATDSKFQQQAIKAYTTSPESLRPEVRTYLGELVKTSPTIPQATASVQLPPSTPTEKTISFSRTSGGISAPTPSSQVAQVGSQLRGGATTTTSPLPRLRTLTETKPSITPNMLTPGFSPTTAATMKQLTTTEEKITVRPAEEQTPAKLQSGESFLQAETSTGNMKFVKIPFSEEQFLKESLKVQPFTEFQKQTIAEAEKTYAEQVPAITARGEIPETKEAYLAKVQSGLTPEFQQGLIKEQYIPKSVEFIQQQQKEGKPITVLTQPELGRAYKVGELTEFYRGELAAGRVPKLAELGSLGNVGVSLPAIAGGVAKGLGQKALGEELIAGGKEAQAKYFAEASVGGETPAGTFGFAVGQIPETYTGIAGASYLTGVAGGAVLKAGLGAAKGSAAIPTVVKSTGTWLGEQLILHPTAAKIGLQYGLPVGLEAVNVGARALGGVSATEQVTQTGKESLFLIGVSKGIQKGMTEGSPIKYKDVTFETTGGQKVDVAKVLSLEEGGKARILLSKQPGGMIKFGTPKFAEAPAGKIAAPLTPFTATEAEVLKAAKGAPGGSAKEVAKIEAIQKIFQSIDKGVAPVKPEQFNAQSRHFAEMVKSGEITPAQEAAYNKALTETVKKYSKQYIELYGSQAQAQQMIKGTARTPADVDIMLRAKEAKATQIAKNMVKDLKEAGIPAYISEAKPTLVTLGSSKASAPHLLDLHYVGEPQPDVIQEMAYGKSLLADTFKVENIPTSLLYKEGLRKAASVGTIQPGESFATATVGPEIPKRAKDVADITRIIRNIQVGNVLVGRTAQAAKVGEAVTSYTKAFGKAAIPTSAQTTPFFAYLGEQGMSGATAIGKIATSASVGGKAMEVGVTPPSARAEGISKGISSLSVPSSMPKASAVSSRGSPSMASASASLRSSASPSSAISKVSASLKSPSSRSPSVSPSPSSPSPSPRSPYSLTSRSPSPSSIPPSSYSPYSRSPSVSPSPSGSPSSRSPSVSPSPSSPFFRFPGLPSKPGGGGAIEKAKRSLTFKSLSAPTAREKSFGFISEGISRQLFGKATKGKAGFSEISAPTAELQKAGITSPGQFLAGGGFVGKSGSELRLFKRGMK